MSSSDRYRPFFNEEEFAHLLAEIERPLPPTIRLNTLKAGIFQQRQRWREWYGWELADIFFCTAGQQLTTYEVPPSQTLEYKMGAYYIQDAASMLPVEMFDDADSPLILDMAAAPGGKTTHLVSRFHDRAVIVANDSSMNRLTALRANLQAWGATGVIVTNFNGEQSGFQNMFDKVLLDAPCSGDTLRLHKGSKQREVSTSEQERLQQRQIALLTSAFYAAKPGGEIVYSTCTLSPDENEAVLDALMHTHPAAVAAVTHLPFGEATCGLTTNGQQIYDPQIKNAIRLWPHLYHTSGFFAAKIRKLEPSRSSQSTIPRQTSQRKPFLDEGKIFQTLLVNYGFDYQPAQPLTFWQHEDSVYAIPEALLENFDTLPYVSAGFLLGQLMGGEFVPSHELITRYENQFVQPRVTLPDEQKRIWLEGRDLRDLLIPATPSIVLLQDEQGRFLGRGKVSSGRIRNLLPKRLIS